MNLGITTIQRNRSQYVAEWVTFHYLVGFRKFYFFIHNCSDNTRDVLLKLKKQFDIHIFDVSPNLKIPQLKCYQDAYANFQDQVDWMAFIDADEFLFPTAAQSMEIALEEFADKKISALGVYWSCFGSSGFTSDPPGLIIENYKCRAAGDYPNNRHIKSLVRNKQEGILPQNPHLFTTPLGSFDENLRLIKAGWTDYLPTYAKFRINHYVTQSRSHFLKHKMGTRGPDGGDLRDESWWVEHDRNEVWDNSMKKFIQPVKDILAHI